MSDVVLGRDSEISKDNIEKLVIFSNKDKETIDLRGGLVQFDYYESILNHTIKVECVIVDTGSSILRDGKMLSIAEGLPLCGRELVSIKFKDINDNEIDVNLYVNKFTPIKTDSTIHFELVSKESILNTGIKVKDRLDGPISQSIKTLVSTHLESSKKVEVEQTSNTYNFLGNCKKPFYIIDFLSKYAVSATNQVYGESAGYFFYETSEGYFFKSIDGLLKQEKKISMINNGTSDAQGAQLPKNYNAKILKYEKDNTLNSHTKSTIGAYGIKLVLFDPFNSFYSEQIIEPPSSSQDELKYLNSEFREIDKDPRTIYQVIDKGTIPGGNTMQQLEKSQEPRFDYKNISVQSNMRYNQLFSHTFKIAMIFNSSIHAGDAIFVDIRKLAHSNSDDVDSLGGGLYIITDIRHRISSDGAFTYCNLVRDSFGRSGTPSR